MTQTQDETTLSQLNALIALFSPGPHTWTQGAFARDAEGRRLCEQEAEAVCFCLIGGMYKVQPNLWLQDGMRTIIEELVPKYASYNLVNFNDNAQTTYESFMAVLHKAHYTLSQRVAAQKGEV